MPECLKDSVFHEDAPQHVLNAILCSIKARLFRIGQVGFGSVVGKCSGEFGPG